MYGILFRILDIERQVDDGRVLIADHYVLVLDRADAIGGQDMLALQALAYLFDCEVLVQLMRLHRKAAASPGQAGADVHIL